MEILDHLICLLRFLYAGQEATVVYIYLAMKNDENNAICRNMDGPRDYHAK